MISGGENGIRENVTAIANATNRQDLDSLGRPVTGDLLSMTVYEVGGPAGTTFGCVSRLDQLQVFLLAGEFSRISDMHPVEVFADEERVCSPKQLLNTRRKIGCWTPLLRSVFSSCTSSMQKNAEEGWQTERSISVVRSRATF